MPDIFRYNQTTPLPRKLHPTSSCLRGVSYSELLFSAYEHFLAAECEPVVSYPIRPDASGYQVGVVIFLFDLLQRGVYRIFQRLFLFRIMDFELKDIGVAAGNRGFEADVVSAESAFSVGSHCVSEIEVGDQTEDESMIEILRVFPAGIKIAEYSFCCSVDVAVHGFQIYQYMRISLPELHKVSDPAGHHAAPDGRVHSLPQTP